MSSVHGSSVLTVSLAILLLLDCRVILAAMQAYENNKRTITLLQAGNQGHTSYIV